MTPSRLLIIGNFSASCQVGSMLGRAAETLGLQWRPVETSFGAYAPSMGTRAGRAYFKLARGRAWEWPRLQRRCLQQLAEFQPEVVIVSGVLTLSRDFFRAARNQGSKVVNFATDDPWARHLRHNSSFRPTIRLYDLIVATKPRTSADFVRAGAAAVRTCTYAFDPYWHRLPDPVPEEERARHAADIGFIGTGNDERRRELDAVSSALQGTFRLYGNNWEGRCPRGWIPMGEALDNTFRLGVRHAKVSLVLLRRGSRDDSTQRTFEIAPCGGCGLYEDTLEHRAILAGYPESGFFRDIAGLAAACRRLLSDAAERERLRESGMKIIVRPENTFAARLRSMIEWSHDR